MHKTIKPESASAAFLHQIGDARWTSRRTLICIQSAVTGVIRSIKRLQMKALYLQAMKDGSVTGCGKRVFVLLENIRIGSEIGPGVW